MLENANAKHNAPARAVRARGENGGRDGERSIENNPFRKILTFDRMGACQRETATKSRYARIALFGETLARALYVAFTLVRAVYSGSGSLALNKGMSALNSVEKE